MNRHANCFTVCFFCLFVCSVNDFSTTRGPIHAKVRMQAYSASGCVFSPFGGWRPPAGGKRGNEIFVTMGVNGEFLHFGGFWAISQQRLHGSTPNIICVGTMSADVPPPPVVPIGPWGAGEGELKTQKNWGVVSFVHRTGLHANFGVNRRAGCREIVDQQTNIQ